MNTLTRCKPLLGTYVEVSIFADIDNQALFEMSNAAFAEIEQIQQLMGFHDPETELSQLNRKAHLKPCHISPQMVKVIGQALELSKLTEGVFDITIAPELIKQGLLPDVHQHVSGNWRDIQLESDQIYFNQPLLIDLGGIAKGYAVDCALAVCDREADVVINAGGDLRMSHWQDQQIAIRHPELESGEMISVDMQNTALATSAPYFVEDQQSFAMEGGITRDMKGGGNNGPKSAMICPFSRQPVNYQQSVSVFAPSCMLADALTKIAVLEPHFEPVLQTLGAEALVVNSSSNQTIQLDYVLV